MKPSDKVILVTGGAGFLGTHVVNQLKKDHGYDESTIIIPRTKDCDLRDRAKVQELLAKTNPTYVIHLATPSGGSEFYRDHPATVFSENFLMGMNVLEASATRRVKKVVIAGSALGYPAEAPQPYKENSFWEGYPAEGEAAYGVSHKMLVSFAEALNKQYGLVTTYVVLPNLYGPNDHFDKNAHVIPSWIMRFEDAIKNKKSTVEAWGSGKALREFLYVEDAARGLIDVLFSLSPLILNIGAEEETSLVDLSTLLGKIMGYTGLVSWDTRKPEGRLRRALDSSLAINLLNFKPITGLKEGLEKTVAWYREHN